MSNNDITGDRLVSKGNSDAYRNNWDKIFGKKSTQITEETFKHQDPGMDAYFVVELPDGSLQPQLCRWSWISTLNDKYVIWQEGSERSAPRFKLK
jgi:hypothetical protein